MPSKNHKDFGRTATALLATTYVLLTGLAVCLFIVFTTADRQISPSWAATCVAGAIGLWFLCWMLRDRRTNASSLTNVAWLGRREEPVPAAAYKPRRRRSRISDAPAGNRPPTVEQLRELSDNVKTWVPSRSRAEKHRRESEGNEPRTC